MAGRPKKRLSELVRGGTFEVRRHEQLIGTAADLPWPAFAELQQRFRAAPGDVERRAIANAFLRAVTDLHETVRGRAALVAGPDELAAELAKLGPPRSAKRANAFFPRFLTLEDGTPFRTQHWQRAVNKELYRRVAGEDRRMYKQFLLGIGRGNGKTPFSTGHGVLNTVEEVYPRVFQAAGSKEQARTGTEFAAVWIEDGELGQWLIAKAGAIERRHGRGYYRIASADGRMLHGRKPTMPLLDEWWLLESRREEQVYVAMVTALQKEPEACLLAATTAGYDKTSQLGGVYTQALELPDIEYHREGFLRIARDTENGFCMWWYGMPEGYELDLENDRAVLKALRLANPSTFVDTAALLRLLRSPGCDVYEWLRLHLNHWTQSRESWLPLGCWAGLRAHEPIPDGSEIYVAIDAALKHDTTAVVWAWLRPDGRIQVDGRAWAARDGAPAHERHQGGRIRNREVMEWIDRELGGRFKIKEIVADTKFFDDYIYELGQRGYLVAEFSQVGNEMREAEQHFFQRATAGELAWYDPAGVMAAHVEATSARATRSGFKVENPDKSRPIDLATAAIMASERCALESRIDDSSVYDTRGLIFLDHGSPVYDDDEELSEGERARLMRERGELPGR